MQLRMDEYQTYFTLLESRWAGEQDTFSRVDEKTKARCVVQTLVSTR
jgi:hypothetical protein